jgi:hypothetical protein
MSFAKKKHSASMLMNPYTRSNPTLNISRSTSDLKQRQVSLQNNDIMSFLASVIIKISYKQRHQYLSAQASAELSPREYTP